MSCDLTREAIPLYYYGELDSEKEEQVEVHIDSCPDCRTALERYQAFARAADRRAVEPASDLLATCRADLSRALDSEPMPVTALAPQKPGTWNLFRDAFQSLFQSAGRLRQPLGAMALLALGFVSARLTMPGSRSAVPAEGEPLVATIRSIQPDQSGRVQISLDETHRRVVSGRMEDPNIQRLILTASHEENNPGVRVQSVGLLKGRSESEEVRQALLDAVEHDPNSGVRLKALDGLANQAGDGNVRRVLSQVLLADEVPGVRIKAIDILTSHTDASMVGLLQNVVERENNPYVRNRCARVLQDLNASVGTF